MSGRRARIPAQSAILAIAAEVHARRARGQEVLDLTVGDFGGEFQPPQSFLDACDRAARAGHVHYPPGGAVASLRHAVADLYQADLALAVAADDIVIGAGARALIYAAFRALVLPGDVVLDPTPSWNNQAYCDLVAARHLAVPTGPDTGFLPLPETLAPYLQKTRLLVLASPGNPASTLWCPARLAQLGRAIVAENQRRRGHARFRPLMLLWDQVYWQTVVEPAHYVHPLALLPDLAAYTVIVDGASKALTTTGLRLGWAWAPGEVAGRMRDLLSHLGAWAPTPAQHAAAELLSDRPRLQAHRRTLAQRLAWRRHHVAAQLRARDGMAATDVLDGDAGLYLTARLGRAGERDEAARRRLLAAGLAAVPLSAFGLAPESGWFRLAIGAPSTAELHAMANLLRSAA